MLLGRLCALGSGGDRGDCSAEREVGWVGGGGGGCQGLCVD